MKKHEIFSVVIADAIRLEVTKIDNPTTEQALLMWTNSLSYCRGVKIPFGGKLSKALEKQYKEGVQAANNARRKLLTMDTEAALSPTGVDLVKSITDLKNAAASEIFSKLSEIAHHVAKVIAQKDKVLASELTRIALPLDVISSELKKANP